MNENQPAFPVTSPETLGKVLRRHRKKLGLTQTAAGSKINLSQKTISQIESGLTGVSIETIFKLMSALGLEIHLEPRNKSAENEDLW